MANRPNSFVLARSNSLYSGLKLALLGYAADQKSTTTYYDSGPNAYNGSMANFAAGDYSQDATISRWCLTSLAASKKYIDLGNLAALYFQNAWTAALWVKPAAAGNAYLFGDYSASGNQCSLVCRLNSNRTLSTWWENAGGAQIATSTGVLPLGEWCHVIVEGNGSGSAPWAGTRALYFGGSPTPDGTNNTSQNRSDVGGNLRVHAAGSYDGQYFSGSIADFMLWNRALTAAEKAILATAADPLLGGLVSPVPPYARKRPGQRSNRPMGIAA